MNINCSYCSTFLIYYRKKVREHVLGKIKWKELLISLLISLGTGVVSWLLTSDSMEQYQTIYKPPLSPPGWLFPVVWTILFILMGIASYLVYISDSSERSSALLVYIFQLAANVIWSVLFFNFNAYLLAFAWLIVLWYLIFITIKQFYSINKLAGKLMIPYLLWVSFAGYLNLAIALHYF